MRHSVLWFAWFSGCGGAASGGGSGRSGDAPDDDEGLWDALGGLFDPEPDPDADVRELELDLEAGWHCGSTSYAAHDEEATVALYAWAAGGTGTGFTDPGRVDVVFPTDQATLSVWMGSCLDVGGCGGELSPCTRVIESIHEAVSGRLELVLTHDDTVHGELVDVLFVGRDGEPDLHVDHLVLPEVERGY